MKKKILSLILSLAVAFPCAEALFASAEAGGASENAGTAAGTQISTEREFRVLSAEDTIYEMGAGWNLGNTLEAHNNMVPNETAWGAPTTTKAILEAVHDQGYNSVRIPVTWGNMVGGAPDYEIDDTWLSRVQDVVDYAISLDMYVLVNVHHDGAQNDYWLGLRFQGEEWDAVVDRFEGLWTNIAERFRDYDEHLIFESMNEIRGDQDTQEDTVKINQLNQTFVDAVRQTGGNNTKRWLAVATEFAWIWEFNEWWELPDDDYCTEDTNRLMVKAHNYTFQDVDQIPYELGTRFRGSVDEKAADKGITETVPCLLTEFGSEYTTGQYAENGNTDIRTDPYGLTYLVSQIEDIVPFCWDTPGEFGDSRTFTIFERATLRPAEELLPTWKAMLRGIYEEPTEDYLDGDFADYTGTPEVTAATSITLSETSLDLGINEQAMVTAAMDAGAEHDIVLWTSSDDDVATVSRGIIRGRSAGVATITAYSMEDESVTATLTVRVTAEKAADSAQSLSVAEETEHEDGTYVFVENGGYVNLTVYAPEATGDTLSFASSDEGVVTVNAVGKVTAIAAGSATVTVMASGGASKAVRVVVGAPGTADSLDVSVVINWNLPESGGAAGYFGTPVGETVAVTGDGQYELTFDLSEHRPADMPEVITSLDSISVVYLVDEAVRTGAATASPLSGADIRYDKVVIGNDTDSAELEIVPDDTTDPETMFRPALNNAGAFNTGGPVNAWGNDAAMPEMSIAYEGYYSINRIDGWNPVLSWTAVEDPTYITITFTLENVEFASSAVDPGTPAESLLGDAEEAEVSVGGSAELGVMVSPADTTSSVSFSSSDSSVAMVENTKGVELDESGFAAMRVYGVSAGTATITARTDNGFTATFEVTVVETAPAADKTALQTRVDELSEISSEGYTEDSYAAFETALTNAETILADTEATQEEVDAALSALNTAYEGLAEAVDKTALQTRYDELKDTSSEGYTSDSFAAFETALDNAETVLADAEATQEEVDAALSALNTAYEELAIEVPEPGPDDSSTADSSTADSSTGGGSTTSSDEEGGCGSTITAAGVVIAVISIGLGAILTLRKRSER